MAARQSLVLRDRRRAVAPRLRALRIPADLACWYAEAGVASVAVPVTSGDLEDARIVREAIYRATSALIGGRAPADGDEEIINRAAAAAPPVPRMSRGRCR